MCIEGLLFDKEIITLCKTTRSSGSHRQIEESRSSLFYVYVCVCVRVVTSHGAEVTGNTEFDLVSRGPKAVQHSSLRVFLLKNARSERYWYGDTSENEAEEELTLPDFCYNHLTKYKKNPFLPLISAGGITFYTTKLKSRYSANWFFFMWKCCICLQCKGINKQLDTSSGEAC